MTDFEQYLALYEIDPVRLSIEAHIRYLTVYNAKKGNPIAQANAEKIKEAIFRLTGIPFTGSFVLQEQQLDQLPTLPINKMQRPHNS